MKRLFWFVMIALLIPTMALSADLNVQWDYDAAEAAYVDSWRLECGASSGEYTTAIDIPKAENQSEYTVSMPRSDFQGVAYCAMKAVSDVRGESEFSNEVVVPMLKPFNLRINFE